MEFGWSSSLKSRVLVCHAPWLLGVESKSGEVSEGRLRCKGALRSPPVGTRRPSARFAHVQILSQGDAARPREENFEELSEKDNKPCLCVVVEV